MEFIREVSRRTHGLKTDAHSSVEEEEDDDEDEDEEEEEEDDDESVEESLDFTQLLITSNRKCE